MKQGTILMALIGLIAGSAMMPAQARGSSGSRTAEAPYQMPAIGGHLSTPVSETYAYAWDCGEDMGCAVFQLKPSDWFASFEVRDTTGLPVFARVVTMGGEILDEFCGKTAEPVYVRGIGLALIHILAGNCKDLTPSTPTTGTVEATFFKQQR